MVMANPWWLSIKRLLRAGNSEAGRASHNDHRPVFTDLAPGDIVKFSLSKGICAAMQKLSESNRKYDNDVIARCSVSGVVKALYHAKPSGQPYVELLSVVVSGDTASRREYVVMAHEVTDIYRYARKDT